MSIVDALSVLDAELQGVSQDLLDLSQGGWGASPLVKNRIEEIEIRLWKALETIGITKND